MEAESSQDIIIVGAGISGLATTLGLHRLGIRSIVLESSEKLRATGFAISLYFNAWKAMDALGISQHVRSLGDRFEGWVVRPISSGDPPKEMVFQESEEYEVRCVQRKLLLEALVNDLPEGTIRFSSKLVHIELSGHYKMVHLSDGTILKTKNPPFGPGHFKLQSMSLLQLRVLSNVSLGLTYSRLAAALSSFSCLASAPRSSHTSFA